MFVKVCGLTSQEDVASALAARADALGFVFAESTRRVAPELAAKIARDVPAGVLRVAVMLHPTQAEWDKVAQVFRPDVLQTDSEDFGALNVGDDVTRWPVYREAAGTELGEGLETFVYEGARSGRGETVDWQVAATVAHRGRMILAGGLGPHNVAEAVRTVRPFGVDASSSLESAPGKKSAEKISSFVAAAKAAATP